MTESIEEKKVDPLEELLEHFGDLFDLKNPKPLKIGVHNELAEVGPMSKTRIRRALNQYVRKYRYIKSVSKGGARFGLKGEDGVVSDEDKKFAIEKVAELDKKRKTRQKKQVQQAKAVESDQRISNKLEALVTKHK